jgi:hypothetical protein
LQRDQQEEGDFAEHSFNLTNNLISEGLEQHVEAQEQLEYLFSFVSASDREILRLCSSFTFVESRNSEN